MTANSSPRRRGVAAWRFAAAFLALLGAAMLSACMPELQSTGALHEEPRLQGHVFRTRDGVELPVRIWQPETDTKAVILALHGFNDYANAFVEPANYWTRFGIATYAYDQRGFGNTQNRGLWAGTNVLTEDAADVTRELRRRYPETPIYLLGESMGGAVATVALARDKAVPADGLILVAPAVWARDTMNPFQTGLLWVAAHSVPWMTVSGRGLNIQPSDNIAMLRALGRDPLVLKDARIDAIYGLADLMDAAMDEASNLRAPVLVLYGDRDEVIPRDPVIEFLQRLDKAVPDTRAAFYPKGYHLLLRDLAADVVMRDVVAWTSDPKAPLPSGADGRAAQALGQAQKPANTSWADQPGK